MTVKKTSSTARKPRQAAVKPATPVEVVDLTKTETGKVATEVTTDQVEPVVSTADVPPTPDAVSVDADANPDSAAAEETTPENASEIEAFEAQDVPPLGDWSDMESALQMMDAEQPEKLPTASDAVDLEIDGVWVRSVGPRFRRAGYSFTQAGCGIALHALSDDELEQLESEPGLVVERVTFTEVPFKRPEAK